MVLSGMSVKVTVITLILITSCVGAGDSASHRTYAAGDLILAPDRMYLAIWDYTDVSAECIGNTTLLKEGYILSLDNVYFINTPAKDGMWGTSIRIANFSLFKNGEVIIRSSLKDGTFFYYNKTVDGREYTIITFKVDGIFNVDGSCSGLLVQLRPFKQYSDGIEAGKQEVHVSTPSVQTSEEWNRTFGKIFEDSVLSVQETGDRGYFLGRSFTPEPRTKWYGVHVLLNRTDANGSELWNRTISEQNAQVYSIQQTADNGFIIAGGRIETGHFDRDAWLMKIDPNGTRQWTRTYGGEHDDTVYSVQQTGDGGYILAGFNGAFGQGIWLIRTDLNGKELWNKALGQESNYHLVKSIQQTADGGYIIASLIPGSGLDNYFDARLTRVDANGSELWSRRFGGKYDDMVFSILQTLDGGYIAAGMTELYGHDAWLIKTDPNGDEQWNRTFYVTGGSEALDVQQTFDGYILAGRRLSYGGNDALVIKTNQDGDEQWRKLFGGERDDEVSYIRQIRDGGYILAGTTRSFGSGDKEAWLIKVHEEPDGTSNVPSANQIETSAARPTERVTGFEAFPVIPILLAVYIARRRRK